MPWVVIASRICHPTRIDRVQMAERVLKDHGDPPAVCLAAGLGRHGQQVLAVKQDLPGTDPPGRHVDEVHDRR
jgi:hypothetical protein